MLIHKFLYTFYLLNEMDKKMQSGMNFKLKWLIVELYDMCDKEV
jgi:hypothetical protein